jgi:hypothetical protein
MRTPILVPMLSFLLAAASVTAGQTPVPPAPPAAPAVPAAPAATKAAPAAPAPLPAPAPVVAPSPVVIAPGDYELTAAEAAVLARTAVVSIDVEAIARQVAQATAAAGLSQEAAAEAAAKAREAARAAARDASRQSTQEREVVRQSARTLRDTAAWTEEDALYRRGTANLDASQWAKAVEVFSQIVAMKGGRADASMYWKAYAQYKLSQREAALTTIQDLQKAYATSRWLNEANALAVEIRSGVGVTNAAESNDDELKLLALNGLMESGNVDQAVTMLEKMLKSQQSPKLKKRALFVLSQSQSPKARDLLVAIAKGGSNPDLQLNAIEYLGMFGGKDNQQLLADIYASTTDVAVKRSILKAYMVTGQKVRLLAAAKSESNASLRADAIRMLGAQGASAELMELYQVEKSAELKNALIEAFMITGNVDKLLEVAKTETDPAVKLKAVRSLGVLGSAKTGPLLVELYAAPGATPEIRRAAIDGLHIQGNAKALVDIARKETDPGLRKDLVSRLSTMKSKEATDFLLELLNK